MDRKNTVLTFDKIMAEWGNATNTPTEHATFTFKFVGQQFSLRKHTADGPITLRVEGDSPYTVDIEMTEGQYEAFEAALADYRIESSKGKPPYVSGVFGDDSEEG